MATNEFIIKGEFDIRDIDKKLKKLNSNMKKSTTEGANKMTKGFAKLGTAIASAFAIGAIVQFGKRVATTRGEFQKLQAVLENTLGNKSAAQQAFRVLNDLASKSNFGLLELTDSYVKLVNQGISPTRAEMVKLQDLANSTGKTFNQLAEATIDAMVGENERLKEFGIRASKQGDNTVFTFKGVQTQVENTSEAITKYLIGLGDLEGVSGSTLKISATLAGRISNLGDAFDNFLNSSGITLQSQLNSTLDVAIEVLGILPSLFGKIAEMAGSANRVIKEFTNGLGFSAVIFEFFKFNVNAVIGLFKTLFNVMISGYRISSSLGLGHFAEAAMEMKRLMAVVVDDFSVNFNEIDKFYNGLLETMKKNNNNFNADFKKGVEQNTEEVVKSQKKIKGISEANTLSRTKSAKEFNKTVIGLALDQAIAFLIVEAIKTFGFIGGIIAGGAAGATARGLFSGIAKFADGGVIGGNSFSGDQQLILANSGERVINIPQQEFLLQAAGLSNEKLDVLIEQNEMLIDAQVFSDQRPVQVIMPSVNLVDAFNEGTKNKALLGSNR